MRKTLIVLILLVFVLPLSAYSVNSFQGKEHHGQISAGLIQKNQKKWHGQIKNADVVHIDDLENDKSGTATSIDELNNHSKSVIKGTVYNLEKMNSPKNMALTKVLVHVDKVISGDKSLNNTTVYLALNGGLVSFDHLYAGTSKSKDFNHEMLVKNDQSPLPSIGSKIITGLIPNTLDKQSEYNNSLKQSGFNVTNSYMIQVPQYNLWIKKKNSQKYILNNPEVHKKSVRNDELVESLQKLTNRINQKFNH